MTHIGMWCQRLATPLGQENMQVRVLSFRPSATDVMRLPLSKRNSTRWRLEKASSGNRRPRKSSVAMEGRRILVCRTCLLNKAGLTPGESSILSPSAILIEMSLTRLTC